MTHETILSMGAAAVAGLGVAAAGGFAVGYRAGASRPERLLRQAGRETGRCLDEAAAAIDLAGRFCDAAANAAKLAEGQIAALVERQKKLGESIGRLLAGARSAAMRPRPEIAWKAGPLDPLTQLPNREGFEANLARLVSAAGEPHGGVLLVSLDGIDRLATRIRDAGVEEIRKSVARVLCRAGREQDLACVLDRGDFAVLLPDAASDEALAQAAAIRDAFRGHPFRLGADGPEVLVTASYGFTPVLPGDEPRVLLDRLNAAAIRARRWGRNRFYAFDAASSRLVQVSEPARPVRLSPVAS